MILCGWKRMPFTCFGVHTHAHSSSHSGYACCLQGEIDLKFCSSVQLSVGGGRKKSVFSLTVRDPICLPMISRRKGGSCVTPCLIFVRPPHSPQFPEREYYLQADNEAEMVKWGYHLNGLFETKTTAPSLKVAEQAPDQPRQQRSRTNTMAPPPAR